MMQKVMQIKVIREDGEPATLKDFSLRYFVGSILCEGLFYERAPFHHRSGASEGSAF